MNKQLLVIGDAEQGAIDQANNCLVDAEAFALMADNHKGYGMPVGGVAVYRNKVSPAGVGFDIACGNKAVKLNIKAKDIESRLEELADKVFDQLSFGVGLKNKTQLEHPLFDDSAWSLPFFSQYPDLKDKAKSQLGTIGSGNHYVDVFKDETDHVWVGVHFGSRGLGHTIASHFMKLAGDNVNIMDETPHLLDLDTPEGSEYWQAMELAGRYAYAGRDYACQTVANILEAEITEEVHNHHNFAWKEVHGGVEYVVVRKGATPAFPDQKGFVGSTMGDNSVIIQGLDSHTSKLLFYSTVHGAGRVLSRTQAAGKLKTTRAERVKPDGTTYTFKERIRTQGCVDFDKVKTEMKEKGIILRGAGADEAPECYKDLEDVLEYHEGTIEILHTLQPLIVCMAGSDEFDPYKD